MKKYLIPAAALFFVAIGMLIMGCAGLTPQQDVALANLGYQATVAGIQTQINVLPVGSTGQKNEQAWLDNVTKIGGSLAPVAADVAQTITDVEALRAAQKAAAIMTAPAVGPTTVPAK